MTKLCVWIGWWWLDSHLPRFLAPKIDLRRVSLCLLPKRLSSGKSFYTRCQYSSYESYLEWRIPVQSCLLWRPRSGSRRECPEKMVSVEMEKVVKTEEKRRIRWCKEEHLQLLVVIFAKTNGYLRHIWYMAMKCHRLVKCIDVCGFSRGLHSLE